MTKMTKPSFAPWPYYAEDEIAAVQTVLASGKVNYWTGEEGRLFEKEFATSCDRTFAVAVANGTLALELALHALGIQPGDEVIVPCRSFVATASCVAIRGARPVFAEVDSDSQNLTPESIRAVLTPRTKAIIPVHLAGWACDLDGILALAQEHGLKVIEDCAQAQGGRYKGKSVGSFGDVATFSFCQDKIMTTGGEGGMLVTNDKEVWARAWAYKDHGKNFATVYEREHPLGFRWLHESIGTNWRLTEMQSAIGRVQLRKLPEWINTRRRYAAILNDRLGKHPLLRVPRPPDEITHAYYKWYAFVRPERLAKGWSRNRVNEEIFDRGVPCLQGSCPEIYLEKAFVDTDCAVTPMSPEYFPVARELGETSMMFVVHPTLTVEDMSRTCEVVEEVLSRAAGEA